MSDLKNYHDGELQRKLTPRLVTMIALGGTIGTGLFLASGFSVKTAGPGGAVVAYTIVAAMVYFIMTGLTEMATYMPVAGSFETYSSKYVDPALGFSLGWNYWFMWAIVLGAEVVAGGILMKYWFPSVPAICWSVLFLGLLVFLNILSVRVYAEAEFYFAGVKVATIIIFLIVGTLMLVGVIGGHSIGLGNFVNHGGPFPNGFMTVLQIGFAVVFAMSGTELLGILAGESKDPEVTIPRANRALIWRISLFYVGAVIIIAAILPWTEVGVDVSPFTQVFEKSGIPYAADIINLVILTSVLSCGNSGTYAASRLLHALACAGKAPKPLSKVNKAGVPMNALLVTASLGCFAFLTGFFAEDTVYLWILSASGLSAVFAWMGISFTHLRFRKIYMAENDGSLSGLKYVAPGYPYLSAISLTLCAAVLVGTILDPASRMSFYFGFPAFIILFIGYKIKYKTKFVRIPRMDSEENIGAK